MWKRYDKHAFDSNSTKLEDDSHGRVPSSSRQSVANQHTDWGCTTPPTWTNQPVLAFIDKNRLTQVRSTLYRPKPSPNNSANVPVDSLQKLRCKRLIPQNLDEDSYLVATMLAIAQWHCYRQCSSSSSRSLPQSSPHSSQAGHQVSLSHPEIQDVPVKIITQDHADAEFVIYSAVVTAVFLKRFAFPSKAPAVSNVQGRGLNINLTRVQIWPLLGLKERLAKALGPQIAGDLACQDTADSDIETWETDKDRKLRFRNLKRKVAAPFI
jgi:hypothetical protein